MKKVIHGYCRHTPYGRVLLGFVDHAPIFKQLAETGNTHQLTVAEEYDHVVGYTVVREYEGHGFLFYPNEREQAEALARTLTAMTGTPYLCAPLAVIMN